METIMVLISHDGYYFIFIRRFHRYGSSSFLQIVPESEAWRSAFDFFLNYVVVMWNWCSLSTISFYSIRITFCEGELQCSRTIIKHLLYVFIILASTDFGRYMADYYTDNTVMFCYVDPVYVCVCVLVIGKINFFILKNVQIRTVFHTCR